MAWSRFRSLLSSVSRPSPASSQVPSQFRSSTVSLGNPPLATQTRRLHHRATAFWSDFGRAIGIPAVAIAIGALLAIGLAEVLLNADSTAITVTVFAIVGAIILAGTTLLALRPWEKD